MAYAYYAKECLGLPCINIRCADRWCYYAGCEFSRVARAPEVDGLGAPGQLLVNLYFPACPSSIPACLLSQPWMYVL